MPTPEEIARDERRKKILAALQADTPAPLTSTTHQEEEGGRRLADEAERQKAKRKASILAQLQAPASIGEYLTQDFLPDFVTGGNPAADIALNVLQGISGQIAEPVTEAAQSTLHSADPVLNLVSSVMGKEPLPEFTPEQTPNLFADPAEFVLANANRF